jgi:glycosyltransferase involved in cell wall biosynthesis
LLGFCDQVVVVDGGSTDGTIEKIKELSKSDNRILLHIQKRDWENKRFAVYDGLQKALARALCTSDFCWQQDSDEVVHPRDYLKIKDLVRKAPKSMDLIALPVVEFWGSKGKVRIDVTPWKWRLSRNKPNITHGIPAQLRKFDEDGMLYSSPGSDGCDYIRSDNFTPIPFVNFYTQEADEIRNKALAGDSTSLDKYGSWIQSICSALPVVIHYSWYDIERKIKTYKNYWSKHWQSLYDIKQEDIPENNMFFNKSWDDVSDKDILEMSERLENEMGGWIFHSRVDFNKKTPSLYLGDEIHPEDIRDWLK